MVIVFVFKPVFVDVPIPGLQAQNHVRYLLKIHVLGSLSQSEFSAFGVETRNLHPANQKMVTRPY